MRAAPLIVSYSFAGHTTRLADRLAVATRATVEHLHDQRDGAHGPGQSRATLSRMLFHFETLTGRRAPLRPVRYSPADFDFVFIGCPVGTGRLPPAMRQWLDDHRADLPPSIAFFATHRDQPKRKTPPPLAHSLFRELSRQCNRAPLATLSLPIASTDQHCADALFVRFILSLARYLPQPHAKPALT